RRVQTHGTTSKMPYSPLHYKSAGSDAGALLPRAQPIHVGSRAVAEPAVELGGFLELLPPHAGHGDEAGFYFRQGGHVAPDFLELGDREDILLSLSPPLLDVLQRHVGRHPGGKGAHGGRDL